MELTLLLSSRSQSPDYMTGTLNHRGALFGKNPFGETLTKNLYYTKRPLCNGQIPNTPEYIKAEGYFLLVDRGGCSFVEKIRNAQKDNATAVLIADNTCLCSIEGSCDADEECEDVEPTMDDDGTGVDIHIPSLLLFKPDADRLRQELVAGTIIEMSLSFPVPMAVNGRTEYMLWTTPDDLTSHQFLNTFFEAAVGFGDKAVFKPRMLVKDGNEKGCRQYDESNAPCQGYCTNYGRYCEPRSLDDTEAYDNKGTKMVVESLRRSCIWDLYGKDDGMGREWWTYVQLWMLQCSYSPYSTSCAEQVYEPAGISKDNLESCMTSSGDFRKDVTNDLLETSLVDAANYHVTWAPKLLVNGALIHGSLTFGTVVEAICATFDESDKPQICTKWTTCAAACPEGQQCVLWGNGEECAEYRAPYLSNENTQFDDDYIVADPTNAPTNIATGTPTSRQTLVPIATSAPTSSPSLATKPPLPTTGVLAESPVTAPIFLPQYPSASHLMPQPNEPPASRPSFNIIPENKPNKAGGGNQDVVETIQIYEGGNGFAIGLGIGIGCMVLVIALLLLLARDRRARKRLEELESVASLNMSATLPRGDWSHASRSHYSDRRRPPPPPGILPEGSHYLEEDYFEDEDEFYYDTSYAPPPPRRPRILPQRRVAGPPPRSIAKRFWRRGRAPIEEEDQEIEELVAQHFQNQRRRQQRVDRDEGQHPRSHLKGYLDHLDEEPEEAAASASASGSHISAPKRPLKPSQKKKIRDVIHLEDVASVASASRRSQRTGSW
jgi:PA domain